MATVPLSTVPVRPLLPWAFKLAGYALGVFEMLSGTGIFAEVGESDEIHWKRLLAVVTRASPTGTTEDKAVMTFDLLNITSGQDDPTWTTSDFTTAEGLFDTWWTSIKTGISPKHTLS